MIKCYFDKKNEVFNFFILLQINKIEI